MQRWSKGVTQQLKNNVWIPTAEQLPAVGEPVLIVRHSYSGEPVRVEPAFLRPDGRWNAMGHKFTQKNVSHWMSMPIPPQEVTL